MRSPHRSEKPCCRWSAPHLALTLFASAILGAAPAAAANWKLVGWNNLGMHCMDADYELFSLLPPYNTIHAQLMDPQGVLVTDPSAAGVRVTYEAISDPTGSINTSSAGKTNFWQHTQQLFGAGAPTTTDAGLAGKSMPGNGNVPQVMTWDPASSWFIAEGIPITPYDDAGHKNYYPMMRLVARGNTGTVLASLDIVLPVSDEMNCKGCHSSDSPSGAVPPSGWVHESNVERDFRLNVLRLHDARNSGDPVYQNALAQAAYDPSGLEATARGGTSILCANCHLSEALPGSGRAGIKPLTQAIHGRHQWLDQAGAGRTACYQCHPGSATRCLRGAMGAAVAPDGTLAMQCQSCHGTMAQVAAPTRTGWLNEPSCQNCHSGTATNNNGQIRYTSVFDTSGQPRVAASQTFATNSDTPAAGLNLYRFSTGHGGVKCEGCHGSTHAEFPALHPNDNIQSIERQGHVGMLAECTSCHATQPNTVNGGPHGMHPVGSTWVQQHPGAVENGGAAQCQTCHGRDYRGTVLSRSQGDRMLSTNFGTKYLWRGFQVGCYTCHQGPSSENANPNHAAVVSDASITTPLDTPAGLMLRAADADGNALTLRIVTQPSHGTVGLIGKQATFFPDAGFTGSDAFTFAAWDGSTDSNLATVSVSVGGAGPTATQTMVPTASPSPTNTPPPAATCPPQPASCGNSAHGNLQLKNGAVPGRHALTWKWITDVGSAPVALGDPMHGATSYTLCVYDAVATVPTLKLAATIPAGGMCGRYACWRALSTGWSYKNRAGTSDGITRLLLKGGALGRPQIQVGGKGAALPSLAPFTATQLLAQDPAVTVQLLRNDSSSCWSNAFTESMTRVNSGVGFKATNP